MRISVLTFIVLVCCYGLTHAERSADQTSQPEDWSRVGISMAVSGQPQRMSIELLRPKRWLEQQGIEVGSEVPLSLHDLDIEGVARVEAVDPDVTIRGGSGQLVTGRFVSQASNVQRVSFENHNEQILATANHRFRSKDDSTWKPLRDVRDGESLVGASGDVVVSRIEALNEQRTVYNLEVHDEHHYYVSELLVLAHNVYGNLPSTGVPYDDQFRMMIGLVDDPAILPVQNGMVTREFNDWAVEHVFHRAARNPDLPEPAAIRVIMDNNTGQPVFAHRFVWSQEDHGLNAFEALVAITGKEHPMISQYRAVIIGVDNGRMIAMPHINAWPQDLLSIMPKRVTNTLNQFDAGAVRRVMEMFHDPSTGNRLVDMYPPR